MLAEAGGGGGAEGLTAREETVEGLATLDGASFFGRVDFGGGSTISIPGEDDGARETTRGAGGGLPSSRVRFVGRVGAGREDVGGLKRGC